MHGINLKGREAVDLVVGPDSLWAALLLEQHCPAAKTLQEEARLSALGAATMPSRLETPKQTIARHDREKAAAKAAKAEAAAAGAAAAGAMVAVDAVVDAAAGGGAVDAVGDGVGDVADLVGAIDLEGDVAMGEPVVVVEGKVEKEMDLSPHAVEIFAHLYTLSRMRFIWAQFINEESTLDELEAAFQEAQGVVNLKSVWDNKVRLQAPLVHICLFSNRF